MCYVIYGYMCIDVIQKLYLSNMIYITSLMYNFYWLLSHYCYILAEVPIFGLFSMGNTIICILFIYILYILVLEKQHNRTEKKPLENTDNLAATPSEFYYPVLFFGMTYIILIIVLYILHVPLLHIYVNIQYTCIHICIVYYI